MKIPVPKVAITFAGVLLKPALRWLSRRRLPQLDGELTLDGLHGNIQVFRDEWGVPHIYAEDEHDLFFAQGFVHAQDRLWQMEVNRRTASGRVSEYVGPQLLEIDRIARTLGFRRTAEQDFESLPDDIRQILEAYADGVNAVIDGAGAGLPIEYTLLRRKPERWTVLDSLTYVRMLTWNMSYGWTNDLIQSRLIDALGPDAARDLMLDYPAHLPTIIGAPRANPPPVSEIARDFAPGRGGSNAWAISPVKSATGNALLANDPHLPLRIPSVWYENHLVGGQYNVTGVSFPGLPAVVIGHNSNIAWGIALSLADVETLVPVDVDSFGKVVGDAEIIEESISVKGRSTPIVEKVVIPPAGPVIPQVNLGNGKAAAISASALRPSQDVTGYLRLNIASNWDQFRSACADLRGAHLNIVYADIDGNIGATMTGGVPARPRGADKPRAVDDAAPTEIPAEELPHVLNPSAGYIISANNRVIGDDYPYELGELWIPGFRASRIEEILLANSPIGIETSELIHSDLTAHSARDLQNLLQPITVTGSDASFAYLEIMNWDGIVTSDSRAALIFEVFRNVLAERVLKPGLPPDLTSLVMGEGVYPLLASETEYASHGITLISRFLSLPQDADSAWANRVGGRDATVEAALSAVIDTIAQELGSDRSKWEWGAVHKLTFRHALGSTAPLGRTFNRGPIPLGGNADTPFQASYEAGTGYSVNGSSQSYRQIIDMGDFSNSKSMYAPGQSGHVGSTHYDDLVQPWLAGEYHPMIWERDEVVKSAQHHLVLIPSGRND